MGHRRGADCFTLLVPFTLNLVLLYVRVFGVVMSFLFLWVPWVGMLFWHFHGHIHMVLRQ